MTRPALFVSTIAASALCAGLLVPFACGDGFTGTRFGFYPDDDTGVGSTSDPTLPCAEPCRAEGEAGDDGCADLIARTCGGCAESTACEAATLLARYEPARCWAALDDELKFPACTARPCEGLMKRVCGDTTPTAACAASPGCAPATVLYERSTSTSSSTAEIAQAEASCAAALSDDAVFAPCDG
jgi:hypothetical protein